MRIVDDAYNAWYWLTDRPYRGVMLAAFAVGCLLLGGWLAGCAPGEAGATALVGNDPKPRFSVETRQIDSTHFGVFYYTTCTGTPDSLIASSKSPVSGATLTNRRKGCPARDSMTMLIQSPGVTVGDTLRGYTKRGTQTSPTTKQAWSYTRPADSLPPPVFDSVTTVRLTMAVTTRPPFIYSDELIVLCPAVRFENNLVGWSSKPFSAADPNHTACINALRAKFPLAQRITSTKAQAVADSEVVAFTWEALDGGVIHPGSTWAIFEPPRYLGVIPGQRRWFSARSL